MKKHILLQRGNEYNKIKVDFEKIGIRIYGITSLEVEVWKYIYIYLSELLQLYPIMNNGDLAWIRVENEAYFEHIWLKKDTLASSGFFVSKYLKTYINTRKKLGIAFNKSEFKSISDNELVANRKVNKKTFIKAIVAHEFGHVLDLVLSGYESSKYIGLRPYKIIDKKYKKQKSDNIVEKAFNRYFGENEWDIKIIIDQIGEYASKSCDEIFAEAIAIHFCGMDTDLSKMIIEELNRLLEDG